MRWRTAPIKSSLYRNMFMAEIKGTVIYSSHKFYVDYAFPIDTIADISELGKPVSIDSLFDSKNLEKVVEILEAIIRDDFKYMIEGFDLNDKETKHKGLVKLYLDALFDVILIESYEIFYFNDFGYKYFVEFR